MRFRLTAILLALGLATATGALAQGVQTGTIRGTVVDQSGAAVPGLSVTITSPALQGQRSAVTDGRGGYTLAQLPPGEYEMTFSLTGFTTVRQLAVVPLGGVAEVNPQLKVATVEETVTVSGQTPPEMTTSQGGTSLTKITIDSLATPRTLQGISTLSASLTENTPNSEQVIINGAFAYDNIFMVNGVDVNDNLFASPFDLFIEDAIEETQVLTSGIPAEYGRFTGGVINAVTKSGGNRFSGSYRLNLFNNAWSDETPFEKDLGIEREGHTNKSQEGTFGGPLRKDRVWFFLAGRYEDTKTTETLDLTGAQYEAGDLNRRGEVKLTGTFASSHTIHGSYINNYRERTNRLSYPLAIDKAGLTDQNNPNHLFALKYQGALRSNLLSELQYSQRGFGFVDGGGSSTNIVDSPIFTLNQSLAMYNAPYFDKTDPEYRNNRQVTGNITSFLSNGTGRHELKAGYEWFRSQQTGGNSQSSTGYVFDADYLTTAAGVPVVDAAGFLLPVFVPGETLIENWIPIKGAVLNVDTHSFYVQDHWTATPKLSADLGLRMEKVRSEATGGIVGVDTDSIVPRLGLSFDPKGDGRTIFHATYGHYSGRYNESAVGTNSNVANPDAIYGIYVGPLGAGRGFAPGFNTANYIPVLGFFPTGNVYFEDGLSAPIVKEFTLSGGTQLGSRGSAEVSYVHRATSNFIEDFISLTGCGSGLLAQGGGECVTNVVKNGLDAGDYTDVVFKNTDTPSRNYQGLAFQGRYNVKSNWIVSGNWTVQLKNEGNFDGEAPSQPASPSPIGDYPEIFNEARHYPVGRLYDFQRHKVRVWTIYDYNLGQWGTLTGSGLLRVDSGLTYSYAATGQPLTNTQLLLLSAYPDQPLDQTVYFEGRGTGDFAGYGLVDTSIVYGMPIFKNYKPYVKFDVYNLFNNQKLINWDVRVRQNSASPKDALGLATGYVKSSTFGNPIGNQSYPLPFAGQTGGRTFRVAFGMRF